MSVDWFGLQPGINKKSCKFCARSKQVQCASQVIFIYSVVVPLSRCANVPSLVSAAQKFTNSEDHMFKISLSLAPAACAAYHWAPQWTLSPYGGNRPTKFELYPFTGLPCSMKKIKRDTTSEHVPCPARAMYTPGQFFVQCRDYHVQICQCATFGFTGSKIHQV